MRRPTIPIAHSRFCGTVAPNSSTDPAGMKSGNARGRVPQMICTIAPSTAASPIVTMITEITGRPTIGRRIVRSMIRPSAIATTTATATPTNHGDPTCTSMNQITKPAISRNSPWAKLMTPVAL